jgi:hypothetical protein
MFCCIIMAIYFKFAVPFHSLCRDIQMLAEHSRGGVGFPRAPGKFRGGLSSLVLVHLTAKQALMEVLEEATSHTRFLFFSNFHRQS